MSEETFARSVKVVDQLRERIEGYTRLLSVVLQHRGFIDSLEGERVRVDCFGENHIDFEYLSHADVMRLVREFPGKWEKDPQDNGTVTYRLTISEPACLVIRAYQGEPPPCCQVIEVEEEVPATTAYKRKVKKLLCPEALARDTELAPSESPTVQLSNDTSADQLAQADQAGDISGNV